MTTEFFPFQSFNKIGRLHQKCEITEKIDGTNGIIHVSDDGIIMAGSRKRWLTDGVSDNHGFRQWVSENLQHLTKLDPGYHYGEWWGSGIQRRYGLNHKTFSLFRTDLPIIPSCCSIVPVLFCGNYSQDVVDSCLADLQKNGSKAAPGFMQPEGVVVRFCGSNISFKKTLDGDIKSK